MIKYKDSWLKRYAVMLRYSDGRVVNTFMRHTSKEGLEKNIRVMVKKSNEYLFKDYKGVDNFSVKPQF